MADSTGRDTTLIEVRASAWTGAMPDTLAPTLAGTTCPPRGSPGTATTG